MLNFVILVCEWNFARISLLPPCLLSNELILLNGLLIYKALSPLTLATTELTICLIFPAPAVDEMREAVFPSNL